MKEKLSLLTKLARDESTGPTINEKFKNGLYYTATPGGYKPIFKSLITNKCVNNCRYCANRSKNNIERTELEPSEFASLIANLDKLGKISGAFISSGVYPTENAAQEKLYKTAFILRKKYKFDKYLHIKIMPGADMELIRKCSQLADRVSVNTETHSSECLEKIADNKQYTEIIDTLERLSTTSNNVITQLMAGVVDDTDYDLIKTADNLYNKYNLKRVYYSAFRSEDNEIDMPTETSIREYRLYQCDRLMKDYNFTIDEIFKNSKNLDHNLDPKANWAINNLDIFPIEINRADKELLLKIPGIGPKTADTIVNKRFKNKLTSSDIKTLKIPKKSKHFLEIDGDYIGDKIEREFLKSILSQNKKSGSSK